MQAFVKRAKLYDCLLLETPPPAMHDPVSRLGGAPLQGRGEPWKRCPRCGQPMEFLLQLRVAELPATCRVVGYPDGLLLVWRCGRHGCDGSLAMFQHAHDKAPLGPPPGLALPCRGLELRSVERATLDEPYPTLIRTNPRVLGLVSPEPFWIDHPIDDWCCDLPTRALLQLHTGARVGYVRYCELCLDAVWIEQCDVIRAN